MLALHASGYGTGAALGRRLRREPQRNPIQGADSEAYKKPRCRTHPVPFQAPPSEASANSAQLHWRGAGPDVCGTAGQLLCGRQSKRPTNKIREPCAARPEELLRGERKVGKVDEPGSGQAASDPEAVEEPKLWLVGSAKN